jgi:hypothetical protein
VSLLILNMAGSFNWYNFSPIQCATPSTAAAVEAVPESTSLNLLEFPQSKLFAGVCRAVGCLDLVA